MHQLSTVNEVFQNSDTELLSFNPIPHVLMYMFLFHLFNISFIHFIFLELWSR